MSRFGRITTEATAAARSFLRRRTAVFFTFFFPVILVVIFGALVQTQPTGAGCSRSRPATTSPATSRSSCCSRRCRGSAPRSPVTATVAGSRSWRRRRSRRVEWLLAHTLVNVAIIGAASLLILGLVLAVTDAEPVVSPALAALPVFVAVAVALFCGLGALLGALARTRRTA